MAKKAASAEITDFDKDIKKQFGNVLSMGSSLIKEDEKLQIVPVSPSLDLALNGGLLETGWVIVAGDAKQGKSTSVLQICKNAQDMGKKPIYLDAENRIKAYNLKGIEGLDLDNFTVIRSPDDAEALSAEDYLKIAESLIKKPEYYGGVLVIDSSSTLLPRSELDQDPSGTIRATMPKLLTHWIKKNIQNVKKNKILVIIITHYITNTSGYGKLKNPDGGVQLQYQADTRMDIVKSEPWEENGKKIGQIVHWKISCSSLGASGTECISHIRFGKGIDKEKEIIELAESFGIIEKGGAWYNIPFLAETEEFEEAPKFQGQAKLYDFLVSRKDIFGMIDAKVKEMLKEINA